MVPKEKQPKVIVNGIHNCDNLLNFCCNAKDEKAFLDILYSFKTDTKKKSI